MYTLNTSARANIHPSIYTCLAYALICTQVVKLETLKRRKVDAMSGAIIYITCKEHRVPRTLDEVASQCYDVSSKVHVWFSNKHALAHAHTCCFARLDKSTRMCPPYLHHKTTRILELTHKLPTRLQKGRGACDDGHSERACRRHGESCCSCQKTWHLTTCFGTPTRPISPSTAPESCS